MKNSKEYGTKIDKFLRTAKAGQKIKPFEFEDPIDALLYGLIAEQTTEKVAKKAFKSIQSYFVDYNDLRVCRPEEIQDLLDDPTEKGEMIAMSLTRVLSKAFDKYDTLSLKGIGENGKRQAHKELGELDGTTRFATDFCFLAAFDGHAIPLTEAMIDFLRKDGLIDPQAEFDEIEGFLLRHIPASSAWEFYELLRHATESGDKKADSKNTKAPKTKKKTAVKKN